jgi:5-formyltetrahydrofolate cyclo-ligase
MVANDASRTTRREMREIRRSLSRHDQQRASLNLVHRFAREPLFWRSKRIAFYLAQDGEIDPITLMTRAVDYGKSCYLPRLKPDHGASSPHQLWFYRFSPGDPLTTNRFGILEPLPDVAERLSPRALDLVLLPLVAFDASGNRLGMGLGYYDQTFAFTRERGCWRRPRLIGLAHQCQKSEGLRHQSWDVPLDGVATDQCLYSFTKEEPRDGDS